MLVAGKSAHNLGNQCGGWTISWQGEKTGENIEGETIFEGISSLCPGAVLSDADGADADPAKHDVAVVVIGETPYAEGFGDIRPGDDLLVELGSSIEGEINPLDPYARTSRLADIHPEDLACIKAIQSRGVPVIVLLVSGRPLVVNDEFDCAEAFVASWLPGSEGGGIADVLFGDYSFTGRLPLPWPNEVAEASNNFTPVEKFPSGYSLAQEFDNAVRIAL